MSARGEEVPVDSAESWGELAVQPARAALEAWGVTTEGLTPDQVVDGAQQIMELYLEAGEELEPTQVARIVDRIRFEAQLVAGVGGMVPEEISGPGKSMGPHETNPGPAAMSADCAVCVPIKVPFPSGWWVVHSARCPEHPREKLRPYGTRPSRETERLRHVHEDEDYRSGVITRRRADPYRDQDGRDIATPEEGE